MGTEPYLTRSKVAGSNYVGKGDENVKLKRWSSDSKSKSNLWCGGYKEAIPVKMIGNAVTKRTDGIYSLVKCGES